MDYYEINTHTDRPMSVHAPHGLTQCSAARPGGSTGSSFYKLYDPLGRVLPREPWLTQAPLYKGHGPTQLH